MTTDQKMHELIVHAGLSHQHRCAACGVLLVAFGREEEREKWSCADCKVFGATVADVDDQGKKS